MPPVISQSVARTFKTVEMSRSLSRDFLLLFESLSAMGSSADVSLVGDCVLFLLIYVRFVCVFFEKSCDVIE